MRTRFLYIIILLTGFSLKSFSQEVIMPLRCNPVIKEYIKKHPPNSSTFRITAVASPDTLSLPFVDDFSKPVGIWPDSHLWLDSGAFINTTYGDDPPTVGVATLDGINKYGNPYDSTWTGGSPETCDTLTSHCINLGGLTAADNVYFSFYYQPQGLGIAPDSEDSLVLEFKDPTDTVTPWHEIWSVPGNTDMPFQRVNISIGDSMLQYLYNGFQFHFLNYAIPNANVNHWNIDYVMLDKGRNANPYKDQLSDVGFINPPTSILNEFQSMPWQHYKVAPSSYMKTSMTDSANSIYFSQQNLIYHATILDANGNNIFTQGDTKGSPLDSLGVTYFDPDNLTNFTYPTTLSGDSATFLIKDYIDSIGSTNKNNDTIYYNQNFFNYYAYDDGSAESSYGLTVSGSIAYQYNIKKADTLLGLQIYFNPTGYAVHSESFEICYWDSLNVNANTAHLVQYTGGLVPANDDSINGFVNYYFATPQPVSAGNIYVGIIQDFDDPIGIGVDVNTNSGNKIFYNIFNIWNNSTATGSLMMRPFFGSGTTVGIEETNAPRTAFDVYPNPANQSAVISIQSSVRTMLLKMIDITGRQVYAQQLRTTDCGLRTDIDVSNFPDGVYFVQLVDGKNGESTAEKLLIQH